MAKKTRYCLHEPHTHIYQASKSSRLVCCRECFLLSIRKEIEESQGKAFCDKLDLIKKIDMSSFLV